MKPGHDEATAGPVGADQPAGRLPLPTSVCVENEGIYEAARPCPHFRSSGAPSAACDAIPGRPPGGASHRAPLRHRGRPPLAVSAPSCGSRAAGLRGVGAASVQLGPEVLALVVELHTYLGVGADTCVQSVAVALCCSERTQWLVRHERPTCRVQGYAGRIRATTDTLARIMREGVVLGETQEPPCGTNVVSTSV